MQLEQSTGTLDAVHIQASLFDAAVLPTILSAGPATTRSQGRDRSAARHRPLPYVRNTAIACAAFLGTVGLAYAPGAFDLPVARFVNHWAHRSVALDTAFWSLDACFVFSGVVLMAAVWYCWFGTRDEEVRTRLLIGTLLSFPVGCVSRFLQHKLSSHPRPVFDPALGFRAPYLLGDKPLNTWNSFPSDHATVFAALLTVVCIARPKLAKFLIPYFIVVESARTYMGAHYPSDLLGGAALAVAVVWAAQAPAVVSFFRRLLPWERTSPGVFYLSAFFLSSQIATLFLELRVVASYFLRAPHS